MVVRFLAAVSLLVGVAVTPGLWGARPEAHGIATVVWPPLEEPATSDPDACLRALGHDDPDVALAAGFALAARGLGDAALRAEPRYPERLLRALGAGRLDRRRGLAQAVLLRLGDPARTAALALAEDGAPAEREAARAMLGLFEGAPVAGACSRTRRDE